MWRVGPIIIYAADAAAAMVYILKDSTNNLIQI